MTAGGVYYNDNNKNAVAWMRELMASGLIAEGMVDGRSITEVRGEDVVRYRRAHWFSGVAGWEYALRLAGWDDTRPVWTGSCPCQPFSSAGKRKGTDDERHLWPEMFRIVRECRPPTIFGEQVASNDGLAWLDGVFADLEAEGYACAAADLCAAGVGAPHIRQRLYWVATLPGAGNVGVGNSHDGREVPVGGIPRRSRTESPRGVGGMAHPETPVGRGQGGAGHGGRRDAETGGSGTVGGVADDAQGRRRRGTTDGGGGGKGVRKEGAGGRPADDSTPRGVAVSEVAGGRKDAGAVRRGQATWVREAEGQDERGTGEQDGRAVDSGPTRGVADAGHGTYGIARKCDGETGADEGKASRQRDGAVLEHRGADGDFWGDYVVIPCRDGKYRRVEPRIFPLAYGLSKGVVRSRDPGAPLEADNTSEARGMRLHGYGNAIVPQVAAKFIRAFLEAEKEMTK